MGTPSERPVKVFPGGLQGRPLR